jgi:hypothetical protein
MNYKLTDLAKDIIFLVVFNALVLIVSQTNYVALAVLLIGSDAMYIEISRRKRRLGELYDEIVLREMRQKEEIENLKRKINILQKDPALRGYFSSKKTGIT